MRKGGLQYHYQTIRHETKLVWLDLIGWSKILYSWIKNNSIKWKFKLPAIHQSGGTKKISRSWCRIRYSTADSSKRKFWKDRSHKDEQDYCLLMNSAKIKMHLQNHIPSITTKSLCFLYLLKCFLRNYRHCDDGDTV